MDREAELSNAAVGGSIQGFGWHYVNSYGYDPAKASAQKTAVTTIQFAVFLLAPVSRCDGCIHLGNFKLGSKSGAEILKAGYVTRDI